MIHQYKLNGYNIVLDVCSGAVHVVDKVAYDVIELFENNEKDFVISSVYQKYQSDPEVSLDDVKECYEQVEFLKEAKCDMIQGYFFSKPIPITEFEKLAFGLAISGKRTLPSESQSDFVFQPEEYLVSQQDFTESNFPASVILRKNYSDDEE